MSKKLNDEIKYKILKLLEENPDVSQRQLAEEIGISVGKANYCLRALIQVGLVKMGSFARSGNKNSYVYILTPNGIAEKAQITKRFLEDKLVQYELLKNEIVALKIEIKK